MSETTPDPADVHTGADRVELTDAERASLNCDCVKYDGSHYDTCFVPAVESIVAARVQALTAERDRLRVDTNINADEVERQRGLLDLARAELQALTAELDRLKSDFVAAETEIRHLRDGTPSQMSYDGRLVPINSTGMREVVDEAGRLRAELAAANARCAELERMTVNVPADIASENADLRATLDRVTAAAKHPHKGPNDTDASMLLAAASRLDGGYMPGGSNTTQTVARVLRAVAALTPEGKE